MSIRDLDHVRSKGDKLFCTNCGQELIVKLPKPITEYIELCNTWYKSHQHCKKTWHESKVNMSLSAYDRAEWWLKNGDVGLSSKVMCLTYLYRKTEGVEHPRDPSDFERCYKFLEVVPELKSNLSRLKTLSPEWSNLVDNWDKLTEMHEQNIRENWMNAEKIGMYQFMQNLFKR